GQKVNVNPLARSCYNDNALLLVVGVKSTVGGLQRRQTLRQTWMTTDLGNFAERVCIQFVVGNPGLDSQEDFVALELEHQIYGDMLIGLNGLEVVDSYTTLVEKTVGFMFLAMERFGPFRYLMMVDDDVYLKLNILSEALNNMQYTKRFYAGQVWAKEMKQVIRPQRDPQHKNYLPQEKWPIEMLLPFAIGPHYILSQDCVEFVVKNRGWLHGVGTLEDVSIALWMLAIQV
ncbi:unnamed protein product, partial [Choristocarpus tenellus]